jgi:hypothetical protein
VNQYDDALYVPLETIFLDEQEQAFAYVNNDRGQIESRLLVLGESNDRVAIVKEGLQEHEKVCLVRPAPEQLTGKASSTWFTRLGKSVRHRIGHYFKSAPADSLMADPVKTAPDFELKFTHSGSPRADSVAAAYNGHFALSDSLRADSVKSKIEISRRTVRDF